MQHCTQSDSRRQAALDTAKAKIIWGTSQDEVVAYLTQHGFEAYLAKYHVKQWLQERHAEIRGKGLKKILIGAGTCIAASVVLFFILQGHDSSSSLPSGRSFKSAVTLISSTGFAELVGIWQLATGLALFLSPKSEKSSLGDLG